MTLGLALLAAAGAFLGLCWGAQKLGQMLGRMIVNRIIAGP